LLAVHRDIPIDAKVVLDVMSEENLISFCKFKINKK